jgi:hypothetical protein
VRLVQQARKDADFEITDRIAAELSVPDDVVPALTEWRDYIAEQILAVSMRIGGLDGAGEAGEAVEAGGAGHDAAAAAAGVDGFRVSGPEGHERSRRYSVVSELPDGRPVAITIALVEVDRATPSGVPGTEGAESPARSGR